MRGAASRRTSAGSRPLLPSFYRGGYGSSAGPKPSRTRPPSAGLGVPHETPRPDWRPAGGPCCKAADDWRAAGRVRARPGFVHTRRPARPFNNGRGGRHRVMAGEPSGRRAALRCPGLGPTVAASRAAA